MPNDIKLSREISEWLEGQGITIEVDAFAPKVYEGRKKQTITGVVEGLGRLYICSEPRIPTHEYLCPFFGSGGADNLLKALRALELKHPKNRLLASNECHEEGCPCWEAAEYPDHYCEPCKKTHRHKIPAWQFHPAEPLDREKHCFPYYWVWGKTDGIALLELLKKLMETDKNGC